MHYSPEALHAFVEAAALGSFSAAARKLRKSQSTISTAIANLEADLALTLFDRSARQPVLTAAGRKVLGHVQAILAASERLDALSIQLAGEVEPRLSMVFSDTYQPKHHDQLMQQFELRYPEIELEWMIAEEGDVIDLLQSGRAHLGMVEVQKVIRRISLSPACRNRPKWGCSSPISTRWRRSPRRRRSSCPAPVS